MDLKAGLPKVGKMISLPEGEGKIIRQNIINQTIVVEMRDGQEVEVPVQQLSPEQSLGLIQEPSPPAELFEEDWEDHDMMENQSVEAGSAKTFPKPD